MFKVLVVDDQALVRKGLKRILNQEPDIEVVGECSDGDEVQLAVSNCTPDVVLMDVRMKRIDGITATKTLRATDDSPPVTMLTTFGDDDVLWNALQAGASGFVLKDATPEDLLRATRAVAAGGAWLDPAITDKVIKHYRQQRPESTETDQLVESLTAREREVLGLVAKGLTNREISTALFVSEATVKTHISHIFSKLDARDRAAAIVYAYDAGIVFPKR